jgi:hypothetical protein
MQLRVLLLATIIISLSFAPAYAQDDGRHAFSCLAGINSGGKGIGLNYERFEEQEPFSLSLSILFCIGLVEKSRSHNSYPDSRDRHPLMSFISPTMRYYFKGPYGVFRYAVGINLTYGRGKGASPLYTNGTNELQQRDMLGIAVTNGLFVQFTRHVRIGAELALGICGDDGLESASGPGTNPFGQLTFSIGYRKSNAFVTVHTKHRRFE